MTTIKFNLNRTFKMVQEGERVLEITECKATPSGYPTEMKWTLKDVEDGATLNDKCNFTTTLWKLSTLASVVLGVKDGDEMDVSELAKQLTGAKVLCEIVHVEGSNPREDGTLPKFANVKRYISSVEDTTTNVVANENPRASILQGL